MNRRDYMPSAALAGQAVLQVSWHAWLMPPQSLPVAAVLALALLPMLPMLALLPAARHSLRRVLLVGGIISLLYFCHGVMELWSNPLARGLAACEIVLASAAIFGIRKVPKPA